MVTRREEQKNIVAVLPPSPKELLLVHEEPISIDKAAELLGVGKQKAMEFCKDKAFPLPHDLLAGEYVLFPTLVKWWRLNRQKVR